MTVGRPSSFQIVTEWGTPWLRSAGSKNREGVGLPAIASRSGEAGGLPPSITV